MAWKPNPGGIERKHVGAQNELLATIWLLKQGYEVFRNVSFHGDVDIVGMKEGVVSLFDVKKSFKKADGSSAVVSLKPSQIALGVKLLCVYPDETFEIFTNPKTSLGQAFDCPECGVNFIKRRGKQKYCCSDCSKKVLARYHVLLKERRAMERAL